MKKAKLNNKLKLNKETVSNLNNVKGGIDKKLGKTYLFTVCRNGSNVCIACA